jgi:hypothetical protein
MTGTGAQEPHIKAHAGRYLEFEVAPCTMSAFDDIAEDDLRGLHTTESFAWDAASSERPNIKDKCEELLRLIRDNPLDVQPTSHFIALLREIWSDAQGRERLLSSDKADAERLVEVAQWVRARATRAEICGSHDCSS